MQERTRTGRVMLCAFVATLACGALLNGRAAWAQDAAAPATVDHATAIKETFKKDQATLHSYEWIETTTMSLKGEVKSTTEKRCYWGADGVLQKVATGDAAPAEKDKRGLRGKAIASKKAEVSDYMTKAAAAIKTYVPPDPAKLQASKAADKSSTAELEPGKRVRVDYKDYNIKGDVLGVEVDLVTNRILGVHVTTMIEGGKEPVQFDVKYAALEDGTGYPAQTLLDAKEMSVQVAVANTGYKKRAKS